MYVTALCADCAIRHPIDEVNVEESCVRSMQLDAVLPKLAVTTNLTVKREVADSDRTVFPLDARCFLEQLAESKH
jgi:hypothetical protein